MIVKYIVATLYGIAAIGIVSHARADSVTSDTTVFSGRVPTVEELIKALSPHQPVARTKTRSLDLSLLSDEDRLQLAQHGEPLEESGLDLPERPVQVNLSKASLDMIEFEFDSDQIKPEAWPVLMRVSKAMQSAELEGQKFTIEGHTDAKGKEGYNLELSKRRAASVKQALVTQLKVPATRLFTIGKGEAQLLNPARPDNGENRRVVFVAF
ncbi:OmpA family protein [Limnobacter sp.]|uniref:OmpA family protein n=1 Tax=Limnobacter sp. TaxID=2003368 RepID=UPI002FE0D9FE